MDAPRQDWKWFEQQCSRKHTDWLRGLTPSRALDLCEALRQLAVGFMDDSAKERLELERWQRKLAIRQKLLAAFMAWTDVVSEELHRTLIDMSEFLDAQGVQFALIAGIAAGVHGGDWKLVAKGPGGPWELYDLKTDRIESNNLTAKLPKKAQALAAQWKAWAERANVIPCIWQPDYKPTTTSRPNGQRDSRPPAW